MLRSLLFVNGVNLASCQPERPHIGVAARVERVLSGQALAIRVLGSMQSESIRLWGISAPDRRQQPWSKNAHQFLIAAALGQTVQVEFLTATPDSYGRRLAYVWLKGQLLNELLVARGHALVAAWRSPAQSVTAIPQYDQRLAWAQQRARLLGLGIWNPQLPLRQTPENFRTQMP